MSNVLIGLIIWVVFGAIMGVLTTKMQMGEVTIRTFVESAFAGGMVGVFMIFIFFNETKSKGFWNKKLF